MGSDHLHRSAPERLAAVQADLAEQLAGAQRELSTNLIALRSSGNADPSLIAQGDTQLAALMALKRQLAQASPGTLAMVRAEIAACVATASNVAQQAQAQASGGSGGAAAELAATRAAARQAAAEFDDAYFKRRVFDPYLQFDSAEAERKYREREAERLDEIRKAQSLNTPEGDKRALDLRIEQLRDAGAHGADKSPDYAPMLTKMGDNLATLDAQITAEKPRDEVVAAAAPDPLDGPMPEANVPADLLAKFKSAGVVVAADQRGTGHGVTAGSGQQAHGPSIPS